MLLNSSGNFTRSPMVALPHHQLAPRMLPQFQMFQVLLFRQEWYLLDWRLRPEDC